MTYYIWSNYKQRFLSGVEYRFFYPKGTIINPNDIDAPEAKETLVGVYALSLSRAKEFETEAEANELVAYMIKHGLDDGFMVLTSDDVAEGE